LKLSSETHFILAKKLSEAAEKALPEKQKQLLHLAKLHLGLAAAAEKYDSQTSMHSYENGISRHDLKKITRDDL